MSVFRVVFLGTPDFAVEPLQRLIDDEHFEVVLVVSQPDRPAGRHMRLQASPVKELALARGLPVITPETVNAPDMLEQIRAVKADAAVVVAFGQILSNEFLALFPLKAVNIHGSLLPRWRGAAPIQRALMAGDPETGVALQIVVQKLDAGPVLGVRKIQLTDDMNAENVYENLKVLGADLLALDFVDYLRGNLSPQVQDESQVTIAKKIKKEEGLIDWRRSSREILNQFRGLYVWPGVWTLKNEKTLKILKMRLSSQSGIPGRVIDVTDHSFAVACGDGSIEILEVQPESRKRQSVAEYLKGYPMQKGDSFIASET